MYEGDEERARPCSSAGMGLGHERNESPESQGPEVSKASYHGMQALSCSNAEERMCDLLENNGQVYVSGWR